MYIRIKKCNKTQQFSRHHCLALCLGRLPQHNDEKTQSPAQLGNADVLLELGTRAVKRIARDCRWKGL